MLLIKLIPLTEVLTVCWFGAFMRVNKMPRRKDIINNLREAIIGDHKSGRNYRVISKQYGFIILNNHKWETSNTLTNFTGITFPASLPQSLTVH